MDIGLPDCVPEEDGGVADVSSHFDENYRFLFRNEIGNDSAFVFTNVDEELVITGELIDGFDDLGRRSSHLGQGRVVVNEVEKDFLSAIVGLGMCC